MLSIWRTHLIKPLMRRLSNFVFRVRVRTRYRVVLQYGLTIIIISSLCYTHQQRKNHIYRQRDHLHKVQQIQQLQQQQHQQQQEDKQPPFQQKQEELHQHQHQHQQQQLKKVQHRYGQQLQHQQQHQQQQEDKQPPLQQKQEELHQHQHQQQQQQQLKKVQHRYGQQLQHQQQQHQQQQEDKQPPLQQKQEELHQHQHQQQQQQLKKVQHRYGQQLQHQQQQQHQKVENTVQSMTMPLVSPYAKTRNISLLRHNLMRVDDNLPKLILAWNPFRSKIPFENTNQLRHCADLKCSMTSNRSKLSNASAVVLFDTRINMSDLPGPARHPWQRYLYYGAESALYEAYPNLSKFPAHYFNWTMTFRRDSDVRQKYMHNMNGTNELSVGYKFVHPPEKWILETAMKEKESIAVWFVSKCSTPSKRELYVEELQKHINVDIYGGCGKLKCTRSEALRCTKIRKNAYFIIAFENSNCLDYITEKYWFNIFFWSIPIVIDRRIYDGSVPKNSFIAASDFDGPKALAERMKFLVKNPKEYMKYFDWKFKFEWINQTDMKELTLPLKANTRNSGMCHLCQKLWDKREPVKTIKSIEKYIKDPKQCYYNVVEQLLRHK